MTTGVLNIINEESYKIWQQKVIIKNANRLVFSDEVDTTEILEMIKAEQQKLLSAVSSGNKECSQYLLNKLKVKDDKTLEKLVPKLPKPLTSDEFIRLPRYAEIKIAESLSNVSKREAATPAFWAACHAVWIGQNCFNDLVSTFLETNQKGDNESKTRNFLRRTGGLETVRGKISVLMDCPIANAWWRVDLARQVVADDPNKNITFDEAHDVLHDAQIWETLTGIAVKSLTAINASRARAAVVIAVAEHGVANNAINGQQSNRTKTVFKNALYSVARLNHSYSLNDIKWEQLLSAAKSGVRETVEFE